MKYVLVSVLLVSCAAEPVDELERDVKRLEARQNLTNCIAAYSTMRYQFTHYQHDPGEERYIDVVSDLNINECERVLGDRWIK